MKNKNQNTRKILTEPQPPLFLVLLEGISGSGKDFVAKNTQEEFSEIVASLSYASFIKDMINEAISKVFLKRKKKLSEEEFESMKNDNEIFPTDPEMSVREMLQYLGTDIIRNISPHFHIKQMASSLLKSNKKIILMPDGRFANEERFVEQYNAIPSQSDKKKYLKETSSFTPDQYSSLEGSLEKMKEMFGDSDFTNYIYDYLVNNIVVEGQPAIIEKIKKREDVLGEPVENLGNFENSLRAGIIFVLRDSDRDLNKSHSSEAYNVNKAREANALDDPKELVFDNNNEILNNKQFVTVIKQVILEIIRKRPNEGEYIYSDELEKRIESSSSLTELRIFIDEVRSIDTKYARKIIKEIQALDPKKSQKTTGTRGST